MFERTHGLVNSSVVRMLTVIMGLLVSASGVAATSLDYVIASRTDQEKSRDIYRNPKETIMFFDVWPGMTVVEALPGRGWYTKILVSYLGDSGRLIGANYPLDITARVFGKRWESVRKRMEEWPKSFPSWAATFSVSPPEITTYYITDAPDVLSGTVDRVLFIRALHHLNRFDANNLDIAAAESFEILKPGGIVGVVQHRASLANSVKWADGSNGYLRTSRVISAFEGAGLKLVEASELNANPKDMPTERDKVWRLPPTLRVDNDSEREKSLSIGESDRMTLKFLKPLD